MNLITRRLSILLIFFAIIVKTSSITTATPIWSTSQYFRAGNEAVIKILTTQLETPTYTFTFSSPLSGIPHLVYGVKGYKGADYLSPENFEVQQINITTSTFSVLVQIHGFTRIQMLNVPYLVIDKDFPHKIVSFDNVPINYTRTLNNITVKRNYETSFTDTVNFTSQAVAQGSLYTQFTSPLQSNKILMFLTSVYMEATFLNATHTFPVSIIVNSLVLNESHYQMSAHIKIRLKIQRLHFSMIMFNYDDVLSSKKYALIYETWETDVNGGFKEIPIQFIDNFIMGMTDFKTVDGKCGLHYVWEFKNVSGVHGVQIEPSIPSYGTCGLSYAESTLLYIKKWICTNSTPYFNLTSNLCQDLCTEYYYEDNITKSCQKCYYSCYECNNASKNNCTACNPLDNRQLDASDQCVCKAGYYQSNNSTSSCTLCSTTIVNCTLCSMSTVNTTFVNCTQCSNNATLFNNSVCLWCDVTTHRQPTYTALGPKCTCLVGFTQDSLLNCVNCSSLISNCSMCYYNSSILVCTSCKNSIPLINNECVSNMICGDGILGFNQQCDDGNLNNNDGCSSECKFQQNWSCVGQPSCCNPTFISLSLYQIIKHPSQNVLTLKFQFSSLLESYVPLSQISTTNNVTNLTEIVNSVYTAPNLIKIKMKYTSMIHGSYLKFDFLFENIVPCVSNTSSSITIKIVSNNNLPVVFYTKQQYDDQEKVQKVWKAAQYISYGVMILSLLSCKIVGVELMGVLQLIYFILADLDNVNLLLVPIMSMNEINGLNIPISKVHHSTPNRVESLGYDSDFINNCNIMLLLIIIVSLLGFLLLLLSKYVKLFSRKLYRISKFVIKQLLLTLVLFNIFNISFSVGLHFTYSKTNYPLHMVSSIGAILAILLVFGMCIALQFTDSQQFGEFKNKLKPQFVCQVYFLTTIVYRILLGFIIATKNQFYLSTILIMLIPIMYFMYNFGNLPFISAYHNYRACLCHITHFITLWILMYYRSMKSGLPIDQSAKLFDPIYVLIVSVFLTITVSVIVLFYQVIMWFKSLSRKRIRHLVSNISDTNLSRKKVSQKNITQAS